MQLFRGVDQEAVNGVLASCPVLRLAAGQTISELARKGAHLYVVLCGALGVASEQQWGAEEGAVINVLPGECVGELSVLDEHSNAPSVTALQDTDLLAIEASQLWQMIDQSNGIARNLLHLLSFRIQAANARLRQRQKLGKFYQQLSQLDGLTGLHNRAWLNENLPLLIGNAGAAVRPLSVIMIDLDHFKRFNDDHGHLAGDEALRAVARVFDEALRPTDFAVRYGGEEFMVILPGTDQKTGAMVAQRLCVRMRQAIVFEDMRYPLPHITGSFGVAALRSGQGAEALIESADAALYRAKEAGRNRVISAS
ncbi:MAG: GGDEF domain-containing protein [Burkholderiaceae bacterium]|nr:GGDEF domain-containing protein [Burkholderiaceae bacterium]